MKNLIICFLAIGYSFCLSCKNEVKQAEKVVEGFQMLPRPIIERMWNEAEVLDYIFHDLPFSMNQSEKPSIQSNITYIGNEAQATIPATCKKPIARQFYQVQGEIELEADIYFGEGCYFYVFYVDGKASYANKMSSKGIDFFNTMIRKALNASSNANGE